MKIIYQVVPILREYLKDGVLGKEAEAEIDKIEREARKLGKPGEAREEAAPRNRGQGAGWQWTHVESGVSSDWLALNRMVLSLVEDYVRRNSVDDLEQLQKAFPPECAFPSAFVDNRDAPRLAPKRLFMQNPIKLGNGTFAVVTNQWAADGPNAEEKFSRFKKRMEENGYTIRRAG